MPLFAGARAAPPAREDHVAREIKEALANIDPDSLTPRAALELLYALRRKLDR